MLKGKNIYLRLLEKDDLPLRVKWINDKETNRTLGFDLPISLAKTQVWFQNTLTDNSKINFAIVDIETDKVIGMTGLINIDYKNKNAEYYITIGEREYLGKKLPDEITSLMLYYAFDQINLFKVYLHTFDNNIKAKHVYIRNGFIQEGVFRQHKWKDGRFIDLVYFGILKEEWEKRN
jgi:RimJ/RimL family protein N-acetyltransferase